MPAGSTDLHGFSEGPLLQEICLEQLQALVSTCNMAYSGTCLVPQCWSHHIPDTWVDVAVNVELCGLCPMLMSRAEPGAGWGTGPKDAEVQREGSTPPPLS
jgi:hypothetical protein